MVAYRARMTRRKPRTGAGPARQVTNARRDKALVMGCVAEFVRRDRASWRVLESGDIELSFNTGEMFLLAENVVVRVA